MGSSQHLDLTHTHTIAQGCFSQERVLRTTFYPATCPDLLQEGQGD